MAVDERAPQNLKVHMRGNYLTLGDEVPRRFPRVLAGDNQPPLPGSQSGRLELAHWLTRPDHPLTSRVMVNRVWQGHFGEGLVRSPDNFGRLGERPDDQPLLDWLATRFVEDGWSIKALHRRILLSSSYQMSTAFDERAAAVDPENRLLWRMSRRRLEAEEIRDSLLAISGQLDLAMGGSLLTHKDRSYVASVSSINTVSYDSRRRSVYLPVIRSALYEVFQAFDFVDPSVMSGQRAVTTVAPQALFMMNSKLMLDETRHLATQLLAEEKLDDAARLGLLYQRAYCRPPTAVQIARAADFLRAYEEKLAQSGVETAQRRLRAWEAICRVTLSSNEFIFLE
jgi:uncharacterized protein DUF1553